MNSSPAFAESEGEQSPAIWRWHQSIQPFRPEA
jgi:hypothetical protein